MSRTDTHKRPHMNDLGGVYVYVWGTGETHHGDDVGDAVSAVDDCARQRPLSHLSGRPGGC